MTNVNSRKQGRQAVPSFRCYGLDRNGRIIVAENVEAIDIDGAIDLGWQFVALHQDALPQADALHQSDADQSLGLEIWHGGKLVFTTLEDRPGSRDRQLGAYVFRRKHDAASPG
jgi:hypothetical protein